MSNLTEKIAAYLALRGKPHFNELEAVMNEIRDQLLDVQGALLDAVSGTSTSTMSIDAGDKSIVLEGEDPKGFKNGQRLNVSFNPTNYVVGTVTGWNEGTRTLAFNVALTDFKGSGSQSSWSVSLSGDEGPPGPAYWLSARTLTPADITATPALATINDKDLVLVDSTAGTMALTVAADCTRFIVTDVGGKAGTNKITITPPTGHTFFNFNANDDAWLDWDFGSVACILFSTNKWGKHP